MSEKYLYTAFYRRREADDPRPPPLLVECSHNPAFTVRTVRTAACRPGADCRGAEPHSPRDCHDEPQCHQYFPAGS